MANIIEVLPVLDTLLPEGRNVVWAAAFQAAWKELQRWAGSPAETNDLIQRLNAAPDSRDQMPSGNLFAAAGAVQDGVLAKIEQGLRERFPGKQRPEFTGLVKDGAVAYAFLDAGLTFASSYFADPHPLQFTDSRGHKTEVRAFGLPSVITNPHADVRHQPRVLYRQLNDQGQPVEFAVDLDAASSPSQLVAAVVERRPTLLETWQAVRSKVSPAEAETRQPYENSIRQQAIPLLSKDVLLVPKIRFVWRQQFDGFSGLVLPNGYSLSRAQQDITFHLDQYGARLQSEAMMMLTRGRERPSTPIRYVFNHPFLLYLQMRGAPRPYFVMWVDDASAISG